MKTKQEFAYRPTDTERRIGRYADMLFWLLAIGIVSSVVVQCVAGYVS